ncbi:endonuclease/exonuclease/phosphatase family protein [Coprobacter secundus]|uniref:Endonuclease/exonuclease/phosphatase domain-containing protein n=1 Tax=Coprobacter secundus subsp. similis TaxID=2751153 RepID=A0A7G1HXN1_9BACT|nr:endonuclease/exonuclease/phosphatase family protein [Coprobacter secundus]BCI63572.1 hypothetical protein Cop2CBH44_19250 [Coprobacter secundus subsp. similis]
MEKHFFHLVLPYIWSIFFNTICLTTFADNYNIGTYNIMIHDPNDFTKIGNRDWNNRKKFVAKTIIDNNFDVIGLQEVEKETQKKDLIELLPDYKIITTKEIGYEVGIAFKKEKFTLLDSGHFFLSSNPEIPDKSWGADLPRATIWAKLKINTSNEIFYFFSTHLDTKSVIARREGSRINIEKINKISSGYPVFLVGDMNCKAKEKTAHYQMKSYMEDSYLVSETIPEGPEGTQNKEWDPNGNAKKRIDFIYKRNANILSYKTINEDYGRGIMPSDHSCIKAVMTLKDRYVPHSIYVSPKGEDSNSGNREFPLKSIIKAIEMAQTLDTIKVAEGIYLATTKSPQASYITLEKAISMIGGYSLDFSKISGYSTLTGDYTQNDIYNENGKVISGYEDNTFNLIYVKYPYCLTLSNFILSNGYHTAQNGTKSAALYNSGSGLKLNNIVFINNRTAASGGALRALGKLEMKNCTFKYNQAKNGGAVDINSSNWGQTNIINCTFAHNKANNGASVSIEECNDCYIYGCSFYNNKSAGIGNFSINTPSSARYTFINNTIANNINTVSQLSDNDPPEGGSAIYFNTGNDAYLVMVNNTITGNQNINTINGSALQLNSGWVYMYNNIVAGNHSSKHDFCDIYDKGSHLRASNYNVFTSSGSINTQVGNSNIMAPDKNTGITQVASLLDGYIDHGIFSANMTENISHTPVVKIITPTFYNSPINVLTQRLMNESFMVNVDLDGGQEQYKILKYDQCGRERDINGKASIGAFEYFEPTGVFCQIFDEKNPDYYYNKFIFCPNSGINDIYYIRTLTGAIIKSGKIQGTKIYIGDLSTGIYIFSRISDIEVKNLKFYVK